MATFEQLFSVSSCLPNSADWWPQTGPLFEEAVDKRAKDKAQNRKAAEDHHLFLKKRGWGWVKETRQLVLNTLSPGLNPHHQTKTIDGLTLLVVKGLTLAYLNINHIYFC